MSLTNSPSRVSARRVTPGSGYFVTSPFDVTKYPDPGVTRLALTREGLFVSDMVMSELMKV